MISDVRYLKRNRERSLEEDFIGGTHDHDTDMRIILRERERVRCIYI